MDCDALNFEKFLHGPCNRGWQLRELCFSSALSQRGTSMNKSLNTETIVNVLPQSRANIASIQQLQSAHTVGDVFGRPGTFLHPLIQQVLFGDPSCPRHRAETSITQTRCPCVGPFRNKGRCPAAHPTPKRDYTLHCSHCWGERDGALTAKKPEGELVRLSGL